MKKKIIILLFIVSISMPFVFPRHLIAGAAPCEKAPLFSAGCPLNTIACQAAPGGGQNTEMYCCQSPPDCDNLKNGTNTYSPPPVVNQDPTCGNGGIGTEIKTAIGCIPFQDINIFSGTILKWAVGIGGGIAFLMILLGSFSVMTSAGNPDRLRDGQSIITAAVSGLILLVLCIFVLKFIGIDILGLGAFGFGKP